MLDAAATTLRQTGIPIVVASQFGSAETISTTIDEERYTLGMGMLGKSIAIEKVQHDENGERFVVRYEDAEKASRPGYTWTQSDPLTEDQLRERLTDADATPADLQRILAETRLNFKKARL